MRETARQQVSPASAGEYIQQRYRSDGILARGGTSDVHAGYDEPGERLVVIKILRVTGSSGCDAAMRRFEREVALASELGNAHVVRYEQCGLLTSGQPYLIMEYLAGEDLGKISRWVRDNLRVESVVEWISQACQGLRPFHERGVAHRDLKPANLFLTRAANGGSDCIKLVDLTLASRPQDTDPIDDPLTRTSLAGFSIGYAPPEQVFGALGDADTRSDTFALGAVIYRMLTGRRAHVTTPGERGDEDLEILQNMRRRVAPIRLSVFRPDVPRELEAVVMRCLSYDPAKRPRDAGELLSMLEPFSRRPGVQRADRPLARGSRTDARIKVRVATAAIAVSIMALLVFAMAAGSASTAEARRRPAAAAE